MSVDTSTAPYYDDYDPSKGFLRVLFQPKAVQARELTQAQTILQEQVNRLGRHLFEEGAMVVPGGISVDTNQEFVKITFVTGSEFSDVDGRDNMVVTSSSGLEAKVTKLVAATETDPVTVFVKYTNSGSNNVTRRFSTQESLTFSVTVDGITQNLAVARSDEVGQGSIAHVSAGIYFVKGFMVQNPAQSVILEKYSVKPSYRVGFLAKESIVTEQTDESLYSNAQGYPNFKAPGAHRLKIDLVLTKIDLTSAADKDFIELARVVDGEVVGLVASTEYNELEKTLAQRTFEESGNYTVNPYVLDSREHLKDASAPNGLLSADAGGDKTKFVVAAKPGISYVKGYRQQNISTVYTPVEKARDTRFQNNAVFSAAYQNYITLTGCHSVPPTDIRNQVELYSAAVVGAQPAGTLIGYARIRAAQATGIAGSFRVYLFDVKMNTGRAFKDVKGVRFSSANALFGGTVAQSALFGSAQNNFIFRTPYSAVKTLKQSGYSDTSYSVVRQYDVTTDSTGKATISLGSNEAFLVPNQTEWFAAVTGASNTGEQVAWSDTLFVLGGTPVGRSVTINSGKASTSLRVCVVLTKQQPMEKTKSLVTKVDMVTFTNASSVVLTKSDGHQLKSVVDAISGSTVTNNFGLLNGQTDTVYGPCVLTSKAGVISGQYQVTYEYFDHSVGDFFSVDSYSGVNYEDISTYVATDGSTYELSDCLDFRPLVDSSGNITSTTFSGDMIRPNDTVRIDATYYLPRIDSFYIGSNGQFGCAKGIPDEAPSAPDVPSEAMKLAEVSVPAYTFSSSEVTFKMIENKRYTMRDIGRLEKRIENLEYYTTLSMLETATNRLQIIDPVTGSDRFKNGFVTEGFSSYALADLTNPEFKFTVNLGDQQGEPTMAQYPSDISVNTGSNYLKGAALVSKSYTLKKALEQPYATKFINVNPFAVYTWSGYVALTPATDFWKDVVYRPTIYVSNTLDYTGGATAGDGWSLVDSFYSDHWWRDGTAWTTTINTSSSSSTSDVFIDNTTYQYMRKIDIGIEATCLRPYTRVYPFFEDVEVSAHCKPKNGSYGAPLITDKAGSLSAVFTVPHTDALTFKTGTNTFRLTDSPTDSRFVNDFSTQAQANHESSGSYDTRQQTVTTTRVLTASTTQWDIHDYLDPIAQSFWIETKGGAYLAAMDIFMQSKSSTVPLRVEIRLMENGYPTTTVVPFGRKILQPANVNVSADGTVPTRVTFDDLIYLEEKRDYAIVLLADTQEYNAWICEMGGLVVGTTRSVSAQPTLGSFFTSQNSVTWSADQNCDMKFSAYIAEFDTNDTTVVFNGGAPANISAFGFNPITTTNGSSIVNLALHSHGLKTGDKFTLSGAVGGNGISSAALNKQLTAVAVTEDSVSFDVFSNATVTGTIGGQAVVANAFNPISMFYAKVNTLVPDGTSIDWKYSYKQQSNRSMTEWFSFNPATETTLGSEGVITAAGDYQITATLKSTKSNLSPVIDLDGFGIVMVKHRINTDVSNPLCQYVTKNVTFDTPSTSARVYVSAKLPGSNSMKLYRKLIVSGNAEATWVEVKPATPLVNDDTKTLEYIYNISDVGSFSGFKLKLVLLGDNPCVIPTVKDIRAIALA